MIATAVQDRVFSITAAFEGKSGYATVRGNGDGMLLAAGMLRWCIGMATLQPLLKEMLKRDPNLFREHLGPVRGRVLEGLASGQASWRDSATELTGSSLATRARDIVPVWRSGLEAIMGGEIGVAVQREAMAPLLERAWQWCQDFGMATERALSLFLDIRVQNGSIESHCKARILDRFTPGMPDREKLTIVADERASTVGGRMRANILNRKMCIITGKGDVDGRAYNLAEEFGLTDAVVLDS